MNYGAFVMTELAVSPVPINSWSEQVYVNRQYVRTCVSTGVSSPDLGLVHTGPENSGAVRSLGKIKGSRYNKVNTARVTVSAQKPLANSTVNICTELSARMLYAMF